MKRSSSIAVGAAAAVFACAAQGQPHQPQLRQGSSISSAQTVNQRTALAPRDRAFMKNAAESGHAEMQASRLALQRASDPAVKEFAQQMIDDHGKANQDLRNLARKKGVRLPKQPSRLQQDKLEMLRAASGAEFERRYVEGFGLAAHRGAVDLFRKEAIDGRDLEVKSFASRTLDKLQAHLMLAQNVEVRFRNSYAASGAARSFPSDTRANDQQDVRKEIDEAVHVVQKMKSDPRLAGLLQRANAVFILPHYGRAALGIGAQGGEGVLVPRRGRDFGNPTFGHPVFYKLGGISIGAQAGGAVGELALLLMTDRAVREFASDKKFSLDADMGLTIVNYSGRAQLSGGKVQDVIVWSDTEGAYAGISVGLTDVFVDREANRAYYGREVTPSQVIGGQVDNPNNNVLGMVLGA